MGKLKRMSPGSRKDSVVGKGLEGLPALSWTWNGCRGCE